jgi:RNA polymerase sigma factor (sigma-70 family)
VPAIGPVIDSYLRAVAPEVRHLTDGQLLDRFRGRRDGDAFAELVRRHGPLVLGVCRRALGNSADADDALQATFLALARRPGAVRRQDTAAPWLYRVALRTARKLARRRRPTAPAPDPSAVPEPARALSAAELCAGLDAELARLPERLRAPLVLCYLDGLTRDEAARRLRWSVGTLKRRLEAGRRLLRVRLERRGLAPAVLAAAVAAAGLRAAVPIALADRITRAAVNTPAGWTGVIAWVVVLTAGLTVALVGAFGGGDGKDVPSTPAPPPRVVEVRADWFGDPLPDGAIQRLGTARHRAANAHVAVTADGKAVVTAGDDLVVRIFDAATGDTKSVRTLDGPPTYHSVLSADGRHLAGVAYAAPEAAEIRVWDVLAGKMVGRLDLGKDPAWALAVHTGTTRVAFVRGPESFPPRPQAVCVWDFAAGGPLVVLRQFTREGRESYGEPRSLFSPDGSRLLMHQPGGQLVCWDVAAGKALWEQPLKYLKLFFFHPDGKHVVISPRGTGFELWSTVDGRPVPGAGWDGKGPGGASDYWPVAASADGKVVACFQGQRRMALYDVARKAVVRDLDDPRRAPNERPVGFWAVPTNFAFTPDGTGFVWRSPTVQRWDVATGKPVWSATWDQGHTEAVTTLLFTPDGSALVSGARDFTFYVWDPGTGRPRHRLPKGPGDLAAFTPDGRTLVATSGDRVAPFMLWDLTSGKSAGNVTGTGEFRQYGSSGDREAAVTPDGKRLMTLTDNHTPNARIPTGRYLTVWDLVTRKSVREEKVGEREETTVLAPGGEVYAAFAVNHPSRGIRVVATATGKEVCRLAEEDLPRKWIPDLSCDLVFSPDGRLLATRVIDETRTAKSVGDRPVKVWDPATGRELARLPASGPARFAFSPDGRVLAVAGADALRVYELASRREARAVEVAGVPRGRKPGSFATALAVGPNGRTAATGHDDGTILLWGLTPPSAPLRAADADAAWAALADPEVKAGWAAVWRLVEAPDLAVRWLGERLKPATPDPAAAELARGLDAADFKAREAAERKLRALGSRAEPALRSVLAGKPSAETRDRVERLLAGLEPAAPLAADDLRDTRAVQVLEAIGSPAARKLLDRLAVGEEHARLTREAKATVGRLTAR